MRKEKNYNQYYIPTNDDVQFVYTDSKNEYIKGIGKDIKKIKSRIKIIFWTLVFYICYKEKVLKKLSKIKEENTINLDN